MSLRKCSWDKQVEVKEKCDSVRLTKAMQSESEFLGGWFGGEPQGQQRKQNAQHVCEHVHSISHDGQAVWYITTCKKWNVWTDK